MGTAWLAATQPGNFAARLGLAISNAGGINEVRAQYAGFFLAVSLVCIATLFGGLSRQTAFIVLIVVFDGKTERTDVCAAEADVQIREIEDWWRRNRTASPDLFADELAATFDILGHAPHIGRVSAIPVTGHASCPTQGNSLSRLLCPRRDQVIVLAVWHGQRGAGPPLRVS